MGPEKQKLHQHQPGAQVLVQLHLVASADVQVPDAYTAGSHQGDHPKLPGHDECGQNQDGAEDRDHQGQKQVLAGLLIRFHFFSNSFATRFSSSWGRKGFFR